jgi:hypothetical protein
MMYPPRAGWRNSRNLAEIPASEHPWWKSVSILLTNSLSVIHSPEIMIARTRDN